MLSQTDSGSARYRSLESLGRGGFGSVELCFDQRLRRTIARKAPHPDDIVQDDAQVQRLLNEARLICYLDHPGVVPIYDIFLDQNEQLNCTMKVLDGEDLETLLVRGSRQGVRPALQLALKILTSICEVMAYAHDKGVLHLDIKPANIMLGNYGEVLLIDWGTARLYDSARYLDYLKASGESTEGGGLEDSYSGLVGTLHFMSPEQLSEPRDVLTPGSDIFSVGVLLYEMLSGRRPFSGNAPEDYVQSLYCDTPTALHELRGDIPKRLSEICAKMLHKKKEDRHQSFHEILQDLREFSDTGNSFARQTFQKGEVLLEEGDQGNYALHIIEGSVEISVTVDGRREVLATRKSGGIIGELSVFSRKPRTATATAMEPTTVSWLTRDSVEKELEKTNPWIGQMIRGLSDKFIEQHQKVTREQPVKKPDRSG